VLQGLEGETLRLEVNGVPESIVLADIVKANLDFEF